MALSVRTVTNVIDIVTADKIARYRIESILSTVPVLGPVAGYVRNGFFALADGLIDLAPTAVVGKDISPFDPNREGSMGYELQCTGIAEAAVDAIEKAKEGVPVLKSVAVASRSAGLAHAAVLLETTDGGQYILDWWLTLELANPYIYRYTDWDTAQGITAHPRFHFRGFD